MKKIALYSLAILSLAALSACCHPHHHRAFARGYHAPAAPSHHISHHAPAPSHHHFYR